MPQIKITHTNASDKDVQQLAAQLEEELFLRDGDLAVINYELNKIDFLPHVVLLTIEDIPAACGGFIHYDAETVEIKRMYVLPLHRRNKLASSVLSELEQLAKENGYTYCLLETGRNQPEAIAFYRQHGYEQIENFGKYAGSVNSICFKKKLPVSPFTVI